MNLQPRSSSPRNSHHQQQGSAYAMALMALLVLTLLSLTLIGFTQTELVLGANQRVKERVFYAAESGIAIASARALVANDRRPTTLLFDDTPEAPPEVTSPRVTQLHRIEISPFYPILDVPCNFCEINNSGTYREASFRKVNHAVTVRASRVGATGEVLAQATLSTMIEFQPWIVTTDAFAVINDVDELGKIKF
jgi:hypothetical protein